MNPPMDHFDWIAFRYALGDLPEADASAFEARLLDDQDAREAVALAVELVGALAIVGRDRAMNPPNPAAGRGRRVAIWASLAAAAAILAAALGRPDRGAVVVEPDARKVASAWSKLPDRPAFEVEVEAGDEDDELSGSTGAGPTPDRPLPSWLVAGATGDTPRSED